MEKFDLIVIGSGPGGYETAAKAAAKGLKVMLAERDLLGGTCLNRGCIPTKSLCHAAEIAEILRGHNLPVAHLYSEAIRETHGIMQQLREGVAAVLHSVTVINGDAKLVNKNCVDINGTLYTAPYVIIATGSKPFRLPIPGADLAQTSDEFLCTETLPESAAIIGGGVIGLEFASILSSFGSEVTVLEFLPEILPSLDTDVTKRLRTALKKRGIKIITSANVTAISSGYQVEYTFKGKSQTIDAECVVMATGRKAVLPDGLDAIGMKTERGFITVDDAMQTSIPGIYAIGDCNGLQMLAHAASAQGEIVIGNRSSVGAVPSAVFTVPECASVGFTEDKCRELGLQFASANSTFRTNGKALSMNQPDGLVKIIYNPLNGLILGCHICGAHASDLIAEITLAMDNSLTVLQIAASIHSHPTLGEVVMRAAENCKFNP